MKMLVDVRKISNKPSGIGYYTYNFLDTLIGRDFEIVMVTDVIQSKELEELKSKGLDIVCYGERVDKSTKVFGYFKFIQDVIKLLQPDIFWEPNNVIPIRIRNPFGKIITTIHDIFPVTHKKYYGVAYRAYFKFAIRNTLKVSDALIYVSQDTKNQVENIFEEARNLKSFVSYNIVKTAYNSKHESRDENYFLFLGNIEKRKGVDILLRAFERYKNDGGGKKLYLVGNARDRSIIALIEKLSKSFDGNVKYLGYLDAKVKEKFLEECSAFVFPSRAEGFGIPPLEALMFNKPCIVSNIGVFKEVLGDAVTYFELSDDDDATANSLKDALMNYDKPPEERIKAIIKRYSPETLSSGLIDFFKDILAN